MPARMQTLQKEAHMFIRASKEKKTMLREAAQMRNLNTSEFVRQMALDAARDILM